MRVVIVVEIVDAEDVPTVGQKSARQVKADEPGNAGQEHRFAHKMDLFSGRITGTKRRPAVNPLLHEPLADSKITRRCAVFAKAGIKQMPQALAPGAFALFVRGDWP